MRFCELDLGGDPWTRLEREPVEGVARIDSMEAGPVRVCIRGAHSRKFPKRSLEVAFTKAPLPDEPPAGHTVGRVHLNADYVDRTLIRSALSFSLFHVLGVPAPRYYHMALSVSGHAEGVYVALESVDADFCRRRGWAPGPIYYATNRNANFGLVSPFSRALKESMEAGYQAVERTRRGELGQAILELNLASESDFPRTVERWFDVERYLRWVAVAVCAGNRDGFVHNYALYQEPDGGRFRIIPWDYDATWGIDINGRPARVDRVPVTGWNKLTHRLLAVPAYLSRYRQLLSDALEGPLRPDRFCNCVQSLAAEVAPWVSSDAHRPQTTRQYEAAVADLVRWAGERRAWLLSRLGDL